MKSFLFFILSLSSTITSVGQQAVIDTSINEAQIKKMLLGKWADDIDSTFKIKITNDSLYYLRPILPGEDQHPRVFHYEITKQHCGASFVKSKTGFYLVEPYFVKGKLEEACKPIQFISKNKLILYQSREEDEGYSEDLEMKLRRCK